MKPVVIVGAGIAGIGSAICLAERGIRVEVYERRTGPSTLGGGVVLWPNGLSVLDRLGLRTSLCGKAGPIARMIQLSGFGEPEQTFSYDTEGLAVLRKDLMQMLLGKLQQYRVRVHYGMQAETLVEDEPGHASIRFANGKCVHASLIVGADGRMRSVVRSYVTTRHFPVYQGFVSWVGVSETDRPIFETGTVLHYRGHGERFGIVPISSRQAYWAASAPCRLESVAQLPQELIQLARRFSEWPQPVRAALSSATQSAYKPIPLYDLDPLDRWWRGNAVLIGDAAHASLPTSGQGACQALEDAWHLARAIDQERGHIEKALVSYTQARYDQANEWILRARTRAARLAVNEERG